VVAEEKIATRQQSKVQSHVHEEQLQDSHANDEDIA
jgi:hypothetical protein